MAEDVITTKIIQKVSQANSFIKLVRGRTKTGIRCKTSKAIGR